MIVFTEIFIIFGISTFLIYINPIMTFYIFYGSVSITYTLLFISNYADYLGKQKVYHSGEFIKHFMQGLGSIKLTKILGKQEYFNRNFSKNMFQYTNKLYSKNNSRSTKTIHRNHVLYQLLY